ncbi:MAG: undecaprenyldiphospho-muramoylpentapeptide beta-N-acetylglucosaminyltransferase [Candidatus Omnitrophica bacterium]|jgi:undecaprenyldiphospho-muramoylpentapeptide beta-N-acetylglucosaminyltransferase|nr:undecaprenyldiphospho-muramoylpentapeptide beta-N-acetylglucosaminyltransferase [Candidatus Omnitrophota bacterium]
MKIMICAAGSGGHIYPALRLAEEFSRGRPKAEVIFLSTRRAIEKLIFEKFDYPVFTVDFISPHSVRDGGYLKFLLKNLIFLLKFIIESVRVGKIVWQEQPDIVVGFGGIGSITAVIAATLLRIPTVIHEQNLVPGRANRFLSRFASKVSLGFAQSAAYFTRKDTEYTGNPLRPGLEAVDPLRARCMLGLSPDKFTVFVFGGSQGSEFINTAFSQGVQYIPEQLKGMMQVMHSTGCDDNSEIAEWYRQCAISAQIVSFCDDMSSAYSAADIVVSRAGAGTINEICFFGRPAVLIPYPYAQGHQVCNARYLQEQGAAYLIPQQRDSAREIGYLIARLIQDKPVLEAMSQKSRGLFEAEATPKLAALITALANESSTIR